MLGPLTKCSGADLDARGWLTSWLEQAYPAPPAKHETPCGIASAAVAWKWALEAQSTAQFPTDQGAEIMQSICKAYPSLRELFLGKHADWSSQILQS